MTKPETLLTIIAEECAETAQRASKCIRFTLDEVQPEQELTNAQRLVYEFNDIVAVMELLQEQGLIDKVIDREAIDKKKLKVAKYLAYSIQLGTVK
jgi:CRISPR/Cas system-associated endonuclease Cas3-HD